MDIFRRALKKRDDEADGGTPAPAAPASAPAMTQSEFGGKAKVETEEQKKTKAQKLADLLRGR